MRCGRMAAAVSLAVGLIVGAAGCVRAGGQEPGTDGGPAFAMGNGGRMVRGTVLAVSANAITVRTESGESFVVSVSPNTRVMKDRQPEKLADVKAGDGVGAMGELDPATKTVHALFVSTVDAEQVKKMRESLGKTWISGKVTAIDELKITVMRSDKVAQTIAVDEDTSFKRGGRGMAMAMEGGGGAVPMRRGDAAGGNGTGANGPGANGTGGESITLADVKVGDMVAGEGGLKGGMFVPKTLMVADPTQRRHRQPGEANGAAPPAGPQ